MSNRIYGTRTDINEQEVRDFYNKRAALASSMKNPLSAVVNGEQNPEQADTRSRFDREYIVPRLDLTQNSAVLDIGCGMGRFAEMVLPLCGRYLGADFAPEMIAAAEKRTAAYSDQAKYVCASFSELMSKPDSFFGGKFDCVIMLGVCMYINDTELVKCLDQTSRPSERQVRFVCWRRSRFRNAADSGSDTFRPAGQRLQRNIQNR